MHCTNGLSCKKTDIIFTFLTLYFVTACSGLDFSRSFLPYSTLQMISSEKSVALYLSTLLLKLSRSRVATAND